MWGRGFCWWSVFAGLYGRKRDIIIKYYGGKIMNNICVVMQFGLKRRKVAADT